MLTDACRSCLRLKINNTCLRLQYRGGAIATSCLYGLRKQNCSVLVLTAWLYGSVSELDAVFFLAQAALWLSAGCRIFFQILVDFIGGHALQCDSRYESECRASGNTTHATSLHFIAGCNLPVHEQHTRARHPGKSGSMAATRHFTAPAELDWWDPHLEWIMGGCALHSQPRALSGSSW